MTEKERVKSGQLSHGAESQRRFRLLLALLLLLALCYACRSDLDPAPPLTYPPPSSHVRQGKEDAEGDAWIGIDLGALTEIGCLQMFQARQRSSREKKRLCTPSVGLYPGSCRQ